MSVSHKTARSTVCAVALGSLPAPALAHHGFGMFDMGVAKHWSGTLTEMHFVNPHSYMEIDVVRVPTPPPGQQPGSASDFTRSCVAPPKH